MTGSRKRIAQALVALAVVAIPGAVIASHRFSDVPDSNVFHNDITWLDQVNVTRGCNPPANDRFCPKDPVTREQMAAFLRRLSEAEVVQAATAVRSTLSDDSLLLDGTGRASLLSQGLSRLPRYSVNPLSSAAAFNWFSSSTGSDTQQSKFVTAQWDATFFRNFIGETTTDHLFVCWISPELLDSWDQDRLAELRAPVRFTSYPAGSSDAGGLHAVSLSVSHSLFVPAGQNVTLYFACADHLGGAAPDAQQFFLTGSPHLLVVPTDANNVVATEVPGDVRTGIAPAIPIVPEQ